MDVFERLTEDKSVHDNTRDGCSNNKAKGSVDVEIRGKSSSNTKDNLESQTDEDDDPAAITGEQNTINL